MGNRSGKKKQIPAEPFPTYVDGDGIVRRKSYVVYAEDAHMSLDEQCEHLKKYQFPFENIIFEGGGVKGLAYAGALRVSEIIIISWYHDILSLPHYYMQIPIAVSDITFN